ncbi:MAG: helix-turn-helix transcriptional regulator [Candidatus Eremiobacteraeota bacterium]|nr:helix-turn-helix transcriptional regulator [Candidatus Eremiobacteraeota bacterium]
MWQERAWARHDDREMVFSMRAGSGGRYWNGFDAFLYEASAGRSEQEFVRHNVSMQIGRPLLVTSRCNGETLRRLQAPGDVKIVPPGIPRVWETEAATIKLSMYLTPALLHSAAETMGINLDRVAIVPKLHVRDPRIEHIGWAVKAELESSEPLGRLYGDSLGLALAAQLLRNYRPAAGARYDDRFSRRRLQRVIDYINEHLAHDLSLAELANVIDMSPSHFKVVFKRSLGVPVHQYVIRTRIEYAVNLIASGKTPLSQIAQQSGFANQSHMARCMKRLTGRTPAALRC